MWDDRGACCRARERRTRNCSNSSSTGRSYESVLVYTYFCNPQRKDGDGSAKGWAAATVHDIMKVE